MEACYGGTDVMERFCAVARGRHQQGPIIGTLNTEHGAGLSYYYYYIFPRIWFLGCRGKKGWTKFEPGPPKPLSDLKQKNRRPAVSPFEVAGSLPKEQAGGPEPEVLLTAAFCFWPITDISPRVRFRCPTFLPLLLFGPRQLALINGSAPIKMREKHTVAIFSSG